MKERDLIEAIASMRASQRQPPAPTALLEAFARSRPPLRRERGPALLLASLGLGLLAALVLQPATATQRADDGLLLRTRQIARAIHVPEVLLR